MSDQSLRYTNIHHSIENNDLQIVYAILWNIAYLMIVVPCLLCCGRNSHSFNEYLSQIYKIYLYFSSLLHHEYSLTNFKAKEKFLNLFSIPFLLLVEGQNSIYSDNEVFSTGNSRNIWLYNSLIRFDKMVMANPRVIFWLSDLRSSLSFLKQIIQVYILDSTSSVDMLMIDKCFVMFLSSIDKYSGRIAQCPCSTIRDHNMEPSAAIAVFVLQKYRYRLVMK
ncbi:hypothetical protein AGLY_015205 [Aphis glycines]|uniref:Uncharacterized protein n=1 Tax=Aphis glycines TaxID=307491 RepID=A0A6G0T1T7_APHGL|nr:hypothetical protein AGLY_015205 [Aphis glycines]